MSQPGTAIQNPLLLEIANLKAALAGYQNAADTANLNLQKQAFEASTTATRCSTLEQENSLLRTEVALLRSLPEAEVPTSAIQVSELTLALRRVSDQLNLSEDAFRDQTEQLSRALNAKSQAKHELEGAYALAARSRGREEEAKTQIRQLELEMKKKEEEGKLADLVVREYADLVRAIEGRSRLSLPQSSTAAEGSSPEGSAHSKESSSGSSAAYSHSRSLSIQTELAGAKPIDKLNEGRAGLQRLLSEFHDQTEKMEEQMERLHGEVETLEMRLRSREQTLSDTVVELADVRSRLATAQREDKSAAKMVERYMAFSQQSTNLLQTALQNQKKRHAATVVTYDRQIAALNQTLDREKELTDTLRDLLGNLTLEISRESFGRRREISLRLALLRRERKIATMIESWIDLMERQSESDSRALRVEEARHILCILREDDDTAVDRAQGDDATIHAIMLEVDDLRRQLEQELERRLELEKIHASVTLKKVEDTVIPGDSSRTQEEHTSKSPQMAPITPTREEILTPEPELPLKEVHPENGLQRQSTEIVIHDPNPPVKSPEEELSSAIEHPVSPQPAHHTSSSENQAPESDAETLAIVQALRKKRPQYLALQAAFDGCHESISQVQSSILSAQAEIPSLSKYIDAAVERLNDYCEDARVELEILISDEARISQGYETLLQLRGGDSDGSGSMGASPMKQDALQEKIKVFIDGSEPSISKAISLFEEKLENLQHDIAIIKRVVHEDMMSSGDDEAILSNSTQLEDDTSNSNENEEKTSGTGLSWRAIASSVLSPSGRASSPASKGVQPFTNAGKIQPISSSRARASSSSTLHKAVSPSNADDLHPLNHLGLRVAMPRLPSPYRHSPHSSTFNIHSPFPIMTPRTSGLGEPKSAPLSRVGSGTAWFNPVASPGFVRSRTMSNVHAVGFGIGMNISPLSPPPAQSRGGSKLSDGKSLVGPKQGIGGTDGTVEVSQTESTTPPKAVADDVE
ncbi:hypothetical protein FRC17_006567 [Serendipita sp. 399]|nr:hypothetical protein FRC17_006567 [Serendipita sp. 399]